METCVQFTKAVVHHANIRDQNLSLEMNCPGEPHQGSPNAPKFEDRSQEETERQERYAREAAWRLAKSIPRQEKWRAFVYPLESLTRSSRDFVHHPLCSGVHHRSVPRRLKERCVQGPQLFNRKCRCRSRTRRSQLLPPGKPSIHACRAQKGSHSVTNT